MTGVDVAKGLSTHWKWRCLLGFSSSLLLSVLFLQLSLIPPYQCRSLSTIRQVKRDLPTPSLKYSLMGCQSVVPPVFPDIKTMHTEIRQNFIPKFIATTNDQQGVVFIRGASIRRRYDTADTEVAFRQESNFAYITGVEQPDFAVAIDIQKKLSILFAPKRDEYWGLWNGEVMTLEEIQAYYGHDLVLYDEDLITKLTEVTQNGQRKLYLLPGETLEPFTNIDDTLLTRALGASRIIKTDSELELMRFAARVSSDAHIALMKDSEVGLYEYNYGGYFVYYSTSCGLVHQSYEPIAGTGNRSAILHYNTKRYQTIDGDIILIDAGAEFRHYGTDITRTFPVNGVFNGDQALVYQMVADVVETIEGRLKEGVSWRSMQTLSQQLVCEKLLQGGFLQGDLSTLIANRMWSYFYPHGLGHSVGLDVHDPGLSDVLATNMVVTVEPGIYFNRAFIAQALKNPQISQYLNIPVIERFLQRNFGGVRIEDIVVIRPDGIENLATAPKSIADIEAIMKKPSIDKKKKNIKNNNKNYE